MLDLLVKIIVGAAAVAAVGGVISIVISGIINKQKLKDEMKKCQSYLITKVDYCSNCIKLEDMESGEEYDVKGDGISDEIYEGQVIYT